LGNYFSSVYTVVNKMNGTSSDFDPRGHCVSNRVRSGEKWKQGRVRIDYLTGELINELGTQYSHEACSDD